MSCERWAGVLPIPGRDQALKLYAAAVCGHFADATLCLRQIKVHKNCRPARAKSIVCTCTECYYPPLSSLNQIAHICRDQLCGCRKLSLKKGLTSLSGGNSGFERYNDEQGFVELSKNDPK